MNAIGGRSFKITGLAGYHLLVFALDRIWFAPARRVDTGVPAGGILCQKLGPLAQLWKTRYHSCSLLCRQFDHVEIGTRVRHGPSF